MKTLHFHCVHCWRSWDRLRLLWCLLETLLPGGVHGALDSVGNDRFLVQLLLLLRLKLLLLLRQKLLLLLLKP